MMIDSFSSLPVLVRKMIFEFLPHFLLSFVQVLSCFHLIHTIMLPLVHQEIGLHLHGLSHCHVLLWTARESAVPTNTHHLVVMAVGVITCAS